jgi:Predicted nucleic-acid-binding protein containing a Zn-ribbon
MARLQIITGGEIPEPLEQGLYAIEDGAPVLLGNRCAPCDRVFFPRRDYCACCSSPILDEVTLSRQGKIGAFSLIDRQPADAWIEAPYIQAEIEMPEAVSVFTLLDGADAETLAIGQPAEVALRLLPTAEGARSVFVFTPVEGGRA